MAPIGSKALLPGEGGWVQQAEPSKLEPLTGNLPRLGLGLGDEGCVSPYLFSPSGQSRSDRLACCMGGAWPRWVTKGYTEHFLPPMSLLLHPEPPTNINYSWQRPTVTRHQSTLWWRAG